MTTTATYRCSRPDRPASYQTGVPGKAWHETGLVFTTRYGTPIEPRNFQRSWQTRCDKASVKPITVHDARRTCATLLADLDVHPRVAMQVLRHARFSVTMEIYTQVSSTKTREALKRLGDSLSRRRELLYKAAVHKQKGHLPKPGSGL